MENVDNGLVEEFKGVEVELANQQANFILLQEKLSEAEDNLRKSQLALKEAESFQNSNSLLTLQQVQDARKSTQKTQRKVDDFQCVVDNLSTTIKNATSAIQKLQQKKQAVLQRLWKQYTGILLGKIENSLGDLIEKFYVSVITSEPGTRPNNFGCVDRLNKLKPEDIIKLRAQLLEEILN
jgi:hypothetical protein